MNLSSQIKKYRDRDQLSQEELAEKIYVSRQTISNWENERSYPDIHNLLLLSVLFDVSLDQLVKGDVDIMKKEVQKNKMNFWTWSMLVFMILMPLSIAPAFKFFDLKGLMIPAAFAIIMLFSSLQVEKMKKQKKLETFSEILAYMEDREVDSEKVKEEKKYKIRNDIFMMVVSAVVTLILVIISFILFFIL